MILHTLIYRFADSVTESEQREFFDGLGELLLDSGHIEGFGWEPHQWLPVDARSRGMTGTAIAQYAARDLETLRTFSELPHVAEFLAGWRSRISYEAAYANHRPLTLTGRHPMRHTEHTVTVDAPVDVVWDVLVDVEGYARIFPPTREAKIVEESPEHQIVRLVVDVNGELQSWVSRRDIDHKRHVIAYRQLELAPLIGHMGGEWRAFPLTETRTQLVITHDFKPKEPVGGKVAGKFTYEEADALLCGGVERNSVDDLGAVRDEAERRVAGAAAA
ncbi:MULTISPECIES: aromatase/cyclase [Streptomyces]|uniref:aromatase/cyclase n=1 Tax=Streptomyces TaxID=1883 RepID=UPI00163BB9EC|nr:MULTISPECIES: aromatase/cyclase [Streptomyces]MBC2876899.1 aromatase/cyclase [Streptomyces sp. TYQ1024]UBI35926.1 aromatase/cyclase [Streptomyces mobaraensis]UKW28519.1 aromatase/cyclase [Streptomyces sp. TYQ1024]